MSRIILRLLAFCGLFGILLAACITPISDFEQIDKTSYFTVEADLSNDPAACKVRITTSANQLRSILPVGVSKATVYVTDQTGTTYNFKESSVFGTYLPPAGFVGKAGNTYQLFIKTLNGQSYESTPEQMRPVPVIENLKTQFEVYSQYSKLDPRRAGFSVYLDFKDNASEGDFYQWTWKHYEPINICAVCEGGGTYNFRTDVCVAPRIPSEDITLYRCNGNCWDISWNNELNIFADVLTNGQRISGRRVARAPYDNVSPYYLRLEQRAITKNAHVYFNSLINTVQNNGSLFDVPAETKFSLNIKSTSNPKERILGLFNVFSVDKRILLIDRQTGVPKEELPLIPVMSGTVFSCPPGSVNCQELVPCFESSTRTKIAPEGWK